MKKLISWNVNGIRAALRKGFLEHFRGFDADILCLQETRASPDQIDVEWPQGYHQYWNPARKKGYSGTAVFTRVQPDRVTFGLGVKEGDQEGRVITLRYPDLFVVNVYNPNVRRDLSRLDFRTRIWDVRFLEYLQWLEREKPVIFCGDLNVAHKEIDLANPRGNRGNAGFTDEERERLSFAIEAGFVDTFRIFESGGGHFSWWSYVGQAREKNVGWRLDYVFVCKHLRPRVHSAFILPDIVGSDHCPVGIDLVE